MSALRARSSRAVSLWSREHRLMVAVGRSAARISWNGCAASSLGGHSMGIVRSPMRSTAIRT